MQCFTRLLQEVTVKIDATGVAILGKPRSIGRAAVVDIFLVKEPPHVVIADLRQRQRGRPIEIADGTFAGASQLEEILVEVRIGRIVIGIQRKVRREHRFFAQVWAGRIQVKQLSSSRSRDYFQAHGCPEGIELSYD